MSKHGKDKGKGKSKPRAAAKAEAGSKADAKARAKSAAKAAAKTKAEMKARAKAEAKAVAKAKAEAKARIKAGAKAIADAKAQAKAAMKARAKAASKAAAKAEARTKKEQKKLRQRAAKEARKASEASAARDVAAAKAARKAAGGKHKRKGTGSKQARKDSASKAAHAGKHTDRAARPVIAVLATLDTKAPEAGYLRDRIRALGGRALLVDMGVVGSPGTARNASPDVTRAEVAAAGGTPLAELLRAPTRQVASPVMIAGATALLAQRLADGTLHGVLGIGGTQGTSNATAVMRALPYGLPKLMVSTVASGDTSAFVDIKDITMMFSVGDLLGLNPLTRTILGNAAAAIVGMATSGVPLETAAAARTAGGAVKPLIGMTNLGVLTDGALRALELFTERGYEVLVFHAVGAGGRAMEQMMKEGILGAVFDYALGEISDELFGGLRAANAERLTVAGRLGLPQVICPGGAEHIGLVVPANTVPERWAGRAHVFHNPIILAPRLSPDEFARVAREAAARLSFVTGRAAFLMPLRGTSRYAVPGGPLHDPASDAAFVAELHRTLPPAVELVEVDAGAEDEVFVRAAVDKLIALIEGPSPAPRLPAPGSRSAPSPAPHAPAQDSPAPHAPHRSEDT